MERLEPNQGIKIEVDSYISPPTSIDKFSSVFKVPPNLYRKLKKGLRVWLNQGSARTINYKKKILDSDNDRDLVINNLLKADIISEVKYNEAPRFCGTFFLVRRPGSKVRPITDFSALIKIINPPKFALNSVYQVVQD